MVYMKRKKQGTQKIHIQYVKPSSYKLLLLPLQAQMTHCNRDEAEQYFSKLNQTTSPMEETRDERSEMFEFGLWIIGRCNSAMDFGEATSACSWNSIRCMESQKMPIVSFIPTPSVQKKDKPYFCVQHLTVRLI